MAKNSLLVSSNFASVVDRLPRYFVLSSSGLRIGSWLWNNFFYPSMENASNTGFWVGGKHLATLLVSVLSEECMLAISKKIVALLGTRTRDLSLLNKSQNYCGTLSTTLPRYLHLVLNFMPSVKASVHWAVPPFCVFSTWKVHWPVQCAPLWLGLH